MSTPSRGKIWGALWVVYIVWGSTYLAIEYSIRSMPPLLAMGSRFLAAGLLMGFVLAIKYGLGFLKITRRQIPFLALLGALLLGLGLGMVTLAQFNDVPTGIVALLISALPFWIAIFKAIDGAQTSIWSWVGIAIGFVGVGILLMPELSKPNNGSHIFWMLMVILGNLGWAFGTYIAPRLDSIATYTAYLWLIGNAPVGLIATYAYVNPVVAVSLGVLFLNEKVSITLLLGAIVVIFGVFLVVRVEARTVETAKPNMEVVQK